MERSRVTVTALICVMFGEYQRVFGTEVKIRVKPGDNVTFFCDRAILAFEMVWIKNQSHGNQSTLFITAEALFIYTFPRFTYLPNSSSNSYDLHIANVSIYDEGIYFCAKAERNLKEVNGKLESRLEYQYGNRKTHLSVSELVTSGPSSTVSPPPVSDCFICWTLLFSVCPVCVLFSSIFVYICVYCFCQKKTTGRTYLYSLPSFLLQCADLKEKHRCEMNKTGKFCVHSELMYRLLPTAHPYDKM
ncbi:hypothetical protein E1301_Tti007077 [Triplophysa tibetana]|uniref:Ig-like domain-containing protein n=1 Tax=Triplophysa tibetana TaxID=1572043 RepID=A0A5A9PNX9_9TELE|nr:hypothetical protein E1301_Tti007077 [Triplophysa tibetana]